MQYSTSDPSTQIPWFATSHGHIDLGTSKDFRERKKQEKKDEPTVMKEENPRAESDKSVELNKASAGSVSKRKESTNSHKVGVGGLPPLVKKSGRQVTEPPKEFPTKLATISHKDLAPISPPEKSSGKLVKSQLNPNRYATKKTISQGMLDIALLTANASQLKYLLQVGDAHEYYTPMMILIVSSLVLQIIVGILFLILGGLDINEDDHKKDADIINNITLVIIFIITVINAFISGFGIRHTDTTVRGGMENLKIS